MKEEAKTQFNEACRILKKCLSNIIEHPEEEKYRIIKQKNQVFYNSYGKYQSGRNLIELLGFELVDDKECPIYVYSNSETDLLRK